ncbi:Protein transport protein Sec61 subunit beta [Phytophthora citrophthora]|uniref:Protein transport protein Sec61 subunit beta n=1 Tax=Phytophthora citrophthora TaxID=4793 RepID=A0AAD9GS86_9STRA|nr:Protein transport protein Sec61 subunit beta [Phytophthora citrophthora]
MCTKIKSTKMKQAVWVMCMAGIAADSVFSLSEAATACSITAPTVSNYTASTTFAAAQIDFVDCSSKVVRVITTSDGTTQLDLSNNKIVYVKSLPSVMQLNLKNNSLSSLQNVSIPSTVKTLDLSKNFFSSFQNFSFPSGLTKLSAANGKLSSLHNFSFPDSVETLNLSNNPIASIGGVIFPSSLKAMTITSSVKLVEFEVRQSDATSFASLQTFNISITTSLTCSDSDALYRYVQDTLLCVLPDDVFNAKYGKQSSSSSSGSVDVAAITVAPELQEANNTRRSKYLVFAAVSLSLACVGLLCTLAPRTLYERYQKKKYQNLKKKQQQQHQLPPVVQPTVLPATNGALTGKKPAPTASGEGAAASGLRNRRPVAAARSGQNTGRGMGGSTAGILRFYTDDSPGLKIGPTTVLVSCLMFVGFVVLLHVWGKFRG